jgi:AcrR family transcriptional regulator
MQVNTEHFSPSATARRAQIISSAISVISTLGYSRASFSQIAKHAGISSTRLISYHFEDKNELMSAVAQAVLSQAGEYMREQILAAGGHPARLAAYLRANLGFIRDHPQHVHAVIQIAANAHAAENPPPAGSSTQTSSAQASGSQASGTPNGRTGQAIALLVQELRAGQADGDFRSFDPVVMAVSIRAAIDAAANLITEDPELDLAAYAEQLVTLFEHATRL